MPHPIVSYYGKGALVALALDLHIRLHTDGACSLDCVMKSFGKNMVSPTSVSLKTGWSAQPKSAAASTCRTFSVAMYMAPRIPHSKTSSTILASNCPSAIPKPAKSEWQGGDLGVRTGSGSGGVKLLNVYDGGAAQACGLSAGDIVIAVDGIKAESSSFASHISSYPVGSTLQIHAFRRDVLMTFTATLQTKPTYFVQLEAIDDAELEESVLTRRQSWLKHSGDK